ncbi:MAG: hypothetical protein NE330_10605 [Lentisphaeraceae bacterium]|nr:hypothetical protein [Lentisphaeraceae bacterium]
MKSNSENPDWPTLLKKLSKSNLDFLVVGGGALVLHGIPRTTMDIDIFVPADDLILAELVTILDSELNLKPVKDSTLSHIKQAELLIGQWLSFAIPNGPEIIDIFFCRKGEFYRLHEDADIIEIENEAIYVANLETLKKMKEDSGRAIDLADIALINEYKELFE